jgi:Tol biopolymer transport system component
MNGHHKVLKGETAMFAISPVRNRLVVAYLVTTCFTAWVLSAPVQSLVVAQEKAPKADDKKSRIFLSATDDEKFVRVILAIDPATGKCAKVCECKSGVWPRVSPDGQALVFTNQDRDELWNCGTEEGSSPGRINDDLGGRPLWSSDGKHLIVTREKFNDKKGWEFETWRLNADGSKHAKLTLPKTHAVRDWSPDGKWLLTASVSFPLEVVPSRLSLMRTDGTGEHSIPKERAKGVAAREGRFSPDSLRIACLLEKADDISIWVSGVDEAKDRKVYESANTASAGLCWSPEGKRLAVVLYYRVAADRKAPVAVSSLKFRLVVMDADGGNAKEMRLVGTTASFLACPEWRLK